MAKIVYNKNVSKPSDVTTSVFSNEEQLRYGEIVLCNSIDEPGIYIFTKNDVGETRIQKVNSIKNIMLDADVDPSETGEVVSGDSLNAIVSKLQNQINALVDSGSTGDTKVSNIVAGVGLNPDGTYSAITGDYIATATSIADAIQLLDAAITRTAESTLQEAKAYTDAEIADAIDALDATETAGDGEVFVKITEVNGIVSGDVKALSVEKDATGLKYDLKLGDYVYGSVDIPQDQFLEEVTFISAATVEDVAEALNYGQHIELGKPYLKFVWRLEEGLKPTYIDVSGLIDIYTAADVKLSDSYTGTSFNIHSGTSLEEAVGNMTTELTTIEESIAANEISSTEKTINISTANTGTSIDVNIDNDTIVKDETVASQGKLSVKLGVERQHIDSGYVRTQYTLKSSGSTYGVINDTRDVFVGDVDEYINVSTEPVSDAQGNRTDKITITPTIQKNISEATSESTEDGNGLVTAWGVKTYIKDGMDGDDIMVGDDNLLQYHPIEFWRGKINFDPQSIFYDTVHEAFFKTDNNMELLDNSLGFDSDGQQVHQYPSARTQDTLLIKDDRTVMDALKTLDKAIDEMDYSADTEENKVFTGITQTNGHVAVTSENLTSRKLAGYQVVAVSKPSDAATKVSTTDTLGKGLGKLQGQINAMDWTGSTTENEVFTGITENDGLISATTKLLTNVKLSGYTVGADTSGKVAATDTLGQALGKLQGQINGLDWTGTTNSDQVFTGITEKDGKVSATTSLTTSRTLSGYTVENITDNTLAASKVAATDTLGKALGKLQGQINSMDYTATTTSDQIFTGFTETDGEVTMQKANVTTRTLAGYSATADTKVAATDTLGGALGKLQGQINSMDKATQAEANSIIYDVTETDGKVSATSKHIVDIKLSGYTEGATTSGKVTSGDTLGQALGKLQGQVNGLDWTGTTTTNEVFTGITESDGKVSATTALITSRTLSGYSATADTKVAATQTLGVALGNLQGQINAMDYSANTGTDKVITGITQSDGKIAVTSENITSRVIKGYAEGTDADVAETDTLGQALGKLQKQINSMDKTASSETGKFVRTVAEDDGKVSEKLGFIENTDITVCAATSSEIASLGANVKEAYKLVNANSATQLGEWIKIYKDSSIAEIYLGTSADTVNATTGAINKKSGDKESLNYVYYTSGGTYSITHIDLETFLTEPEFKSGVTVTNHIAHGVVSGGSESVVTAYTATGAANGTAKVLGVDANGFYVSNIQKAIDAKVNSAVSLLDSSSATTGNRKYVTGITIKDGKITSFAEAGDPTLTTGNSTTATGNVVTGLSVSDHAITLNKKNFPEVAWKIITAGGTSISATTTADTISIVTGNTGITLVGDATNKRITISHTDTSSQASVDAGAGKFIKSVTLDTYGHVSGLTTGDAVNSATTAANSDKLGGTTKGNLFTSFTSPDSATTSAPETSITVGGTEKKAKVNADMVDGKHISVVSSLPATRSADTIYILI